MFGDVSHANDGDNGGERGEWRVYREVVGGTGWKPCGQCDGTGKNQEDLYGGKFLKGDRCWLCDGKAKTMCGNCIDMTDTF